VSGLCGCLKAPRALSTGASCAGLTRASIFFVRNFCEDRWIAGSSARLRASFDALCPAMTTQHVRKSWGLLQRRAQQRLPGALHRASGMVERHAREAVAQVAGRRGCEKAPRQQAREVERRGRAQALERRDEPLLDRGEIAAEGKRQQQALVARGRERASDALGRVVAAGGRQLEALLDLAGIARAPQQF